MVTHEGGYLTYHSFGYEHSLRMMGGSNTVGSKCDELYSIGNVGNTVQAPWLLSLESIGACRGKGKICVGMILSVWHGNFLT